MKQSEAKELVRIISIAVSRTRSQITEGLAGWGKDLDRTEKTVMNILDKYTFPEDESFDGFGIPQAVFRLQSKEELAPIDLYNLLILVNKSTFLLFALEVIYKTKVPDVERIPVWITGWEDE